MWHEIGLRGQAAAATETVFMNFCTKIRVQFAELIKYPLIIHDQYGILRKQKVLLKYSFWHKNS